MATKSIPQPVSYIRRNDYGTIDASCNYPDDYKMAIKSAYALATRAAKLGKIVPEEDALYWEKVSCRIGRKRIGSAVYHELYDVSLDGKHALICVRQVSGTRYGIATIDKSYFTLHKHGRYGVRVTEVPKSIAAKTAKAQSSYPGTAIEQLDQRVSDELHKKAKAAAKAAAKASPPQAAQS